MDIHGSIELDGTIYGELTPEESITGRLSSLHDMSGNLSPGSTVVNSYNKLKDKPKINGVELIDDKSFEDLGDTPLTNLEIKTIFNNIFGN